MHAKNELLNYPPSQSRAQRQSKTGQVAIESKYRKTPTHTSNHTYNIDKEERRYNAPEKEKKWK